MLITVMSERELHVPRFGRIEAADGFRLVSAMNPFDAVGTARISSAVYDRVCRIAVDYQSDADELTIMRRELAAAPPAAGDVDDDAVAVWQQRIVELVRATRQHPDLRIGSSVRGAIDLVLVAQFARQPSAHGSERPERVVRCRAGCAVRPGSAAGGRQPDRRGRHSRVVRRHVRSDDRGGR